MLKRAGAARLHARAEDDGLSLDDEVLITILSHVAGSTADLVRCAATCRRWRRLVSTNAALICRHAPRPIWSKSFIRFFDLNTTSAAPVPRPLYWLSKPLCGGLIRGHGHQMLDASSRVVVSLGGFLAAEIRRAGSGGSTLRLRVCNPATGEVDCLPCLLTADNRRSFTAARCFSSDAGGWGPEAQVFGARVGRAQLHATRPQATRAAIVHRGVVFWPRLRLALLTLPAGGEGAAAVRSLSTSPLYDREGSMLGLMPDDRLCWVEVDGTVMCVSLSHNGDMLCLHDGTLNGSWRRPPWSIPLLRVMPEFSSATSSVTPRWFYEKSGAIFVTAKIGHGVCDGERCYTVMVSTKKIYQVLRGGASDGEPWGDMYGYELDREKFLGSLLDWGPGN